MRRLTQSLVAGAMGVLLVTVLLGATHQLTTPSDPLSLGDDGIRFPDGTLLTSAAGSYANVLVVAKSGGHYTSIQAALDSITDASESNPYLVWVAPGVYTEQVTMKPWVDIQGSGVGATKITSSSPPTVQGANDAELRYLTVQSTSGLAIWNREASPSLNHVAAVAVGSNVDAQTIAVLNESLASPTMTNVTATASGYQAYGVRSTNSSPTMRNVTASAAGTYNTKAVFISGSSSSEMRDVTATSSGGGFYSTGIHIYESSLTMLNVTAAASGGSALNTGVSVHAGPQSGSSVVMTNVTATGVAGTTSPPTEGTGVYVGAAGANPATLTVRNSRFLGAGEAIDLRWKSHAHVAHSILDGPAAGSGTYSCFSVCDANLDALGSDCQPPP